MVHTEKQCYIVKAALHCSSLLGGSVLGRGWLHSSCHGDALDLFFYAAGCGRSTASFLVVLSHVLCDPRKWTKMFWMLTVKRSNIVSQFTPRKENDVWFYMEFYIEHLETNFKIKFHCFTFSQFLWCIIFLMYLDLVSCELIFLVIQK